MTEAKIDDGSKKRGSDVAMKKYRIIISTLILSALVCLNCAQIAVKKKVGPPLAAIPQPLWQYDTGG